MGDVSHILAAGAPPKVENPLTTLGTVQGIINSETQNRLTEQNILNTKQNLLNLQQSHEKGDLEITAKKQGMAGGIAFVAANDQDLTHERSQYYLDLGEKLGYPPDQIAALRAELKPDMTNEQRQNIFRHVAYASVGPKVAQDMMTPTTEWRNNGQIDYPMIIEKPGQGSQPGVPVPAWKDGRGIGAPGGIQQHPAPGWQQGVTPGGQTVQTPSPSLNPFGQPVDLTQPGGSDGTKKGGLVVTKLSPEEEAANKESAEHFTKETSFSGAYTQLNQQNLGALEGLRRADVGPSSTNRNWAKSFLLSVAPDIAGRLGIDESKINWFDEAQKYLTARRAALSGSASTDYSRYEKELSNPSVEISQKAAIHMHLINAGFDNMRQAAIQTYMNQPQNQGKGLGDASVAAGFRRYWNDYMNSHDYRAFMPENQQERHATISKLSDSEEERYSKSLKDANTIGVRVSP